MEVKPLVKEAILKFFSTKKASIVCITIAVISKIIVAWLYISLQGDKSLYLLLAKNFADTGLMREPLQAVENGALLTVYNTAAISPLYSFFSLPLLAFISSAETVSRMLDLVAWIIFFLGLYKIGRLLFPQRWMTNVAILLTGFFLYPHEMLSVPKDTFAIAFTLFAVYYSYAFITSQPSFVITLKLFFSLLFLCLIKLLYVPVSPVLVALLIVVAVCKKQKQQLLFSIGLLIALAGAIGLIYVALLLPSTSLLVLPGSGPMVVAGFYPKNLLGTYPFFSAAFFNIDLWGVQVQQWSKLPYVAVIRVFQVIDVFILSGLLTLLFLANPVRKYKLFALLSVPAIVLTGFVVFLSLSHNVIDKTTNVNWTYVGEARSFLFPIVCLQLFIFWLLFTRAVLPRWIKIIFILLFAFSSLHGFYFRAKIAATKNKVLEARHNNTPEKKVVSYVQKISQTGQSVELVTFHHQLRRYSSLQGIATFSFTGQPADSRWMAQRHHFIIATHAEDSLMVYKLFPKRTLVTLDTIGQYILQQYIAND